MKYANRLAELRTLKGYTQEEAAEAMNLSLGGYRKLEYGERRLKAEQIAIAAKAFGVPDSDVLEGTRTAPVMGFIGAGALIEPEFEQVPGEGLYSVDLPFSIPDNIIAFEVRGDSMLPRYDDGDVVLVYAEQHRSTESFLGEEVAVRTADGRRFLKRLMRGHTSRHSFNLESWNATTIEDVQLEWVGEVYLTVRSGQLRRIEARERAKSARRRARHLTATEGMEELPLKTG
jgi:repressor LexA